MKMIKDECSNCGAISTLHDPDGNIKCLECEHITETPHAAWKPPSPVPSITVGRYRKADGFQTRNFAIHVDGILLAVTVYRKGAAAVRSKLLELLDGTDMSPALPTCYGEGCILTPAQRADFVRACGGPVSIELARENGFCAVAEPFSDHPVKLERTP
jgi:hypothetical protein